MTDHTQSLRLFCIVFLCFLATFLWSLLLLLGPYHFCFLSCPSLHEMFPWHLWFLEELSSLSCSIFSPLFLCIVHLRRASYLSLLFSETLHSVGYIFSSAICKVSSDNHFSFLHFFFFTMVLVTVFCTMLGTSIHCSSQALCLLDLIPCHLQCTIIRDLI